MPFIKNEPPSQALVPPIGLSKQWGPPQHTFQMSKATIDMKVK
jgi:hypothetical protein